jgi:hypothetical protein
MMMNFGSGKLSHCWRGITETLERFELKTSTVDKGAGWGNSVKWANLDFLTKEYQWTECVEENDHYRAFRLSYMT